MTIKTISMIETGNFIIFDVDGDQYYRLASYSTPEATWLLRNNCRFLKLTEEEKLKTLNDLYENYMFSPKKKMDLLTEEVFIKIAEAIKGKENFKSSLFQPNAHYGFTYRIIVKNETDTIFFFVEERRNIRTNGRPLKPNSFLLATFNSDGKITLNIPPKIFSTRKKRIMLIRRFFKLLNNLNPKIPLCHYSESRKHENLDPILYTYSLNNKKMCQKAIGTFAIDDSFFSNFKTLN